MNILFTSAGRRVELLKNCKHSIGSEGCLVAADLSEYAPALYVADYHYLVPRIDDTAYIPTLVELCKKHNINAITALIDPEIEILANNRSAFEEIDVEVLAPEEPTAAICFDKYKFCKYFQEKGIDTIDTWNSFDSFKKAYESNEVAFPAFVKPRCGSGSVGIKKVSSLKELEDAFNIDSNLIVQRFMDGEDICADIYVDTISGELVSCFTMKKIETKIGGANKTISFIDYSLIDFIKVIVEKLELKGPSNLDFFYQDGKYYLSEINPRFGGSYLHAYGTGVDFFKCIENNVNGIVNKHSLDNYPENTVMMMYDSVIVEQMKAIAKAETYVVVPARKMGGV